MDTGETEDNSASLYTETVTLLPKRTSARGSVLATCVAVLGTLSFGYCLGYSSPASYDLKTASNNSTIHLSNSQESWFSVCSQVILYQLVVIFFVLT